MGGNGFDSTEDWLLSRDAANLGSSVRNRSSVRGGLSTSDRDRLKELERENRELKRANKILRKVSAYFAQALVYERLQFAK